MSEPAILFSRQGGLLTVQLNRPDRLNALSGEMMDLFEAHLLPATTDPDVRAILITGSGRAFCAGGDIGAMGRGPDRDTSRDSMRRMHRWLAALRASHAIVITAANGAAAGGGFGLAMISDILVASESAFFKAGFTSLGVAIDYGLGWTLPLAVGAQRAAEIIFSERRVGAEEALRIGMVARLFPEHSFRDDAGTFAAAIANAPWAARVSKQLLHFRHPEFLRYLEAEAEGQADAFQTADFREGCAAFAAKRPPHFEGK